MSELSDLTVAELKDLLRDAGLPVSGKKADLIARLEEAEEHDEDIEEEEVDTEDETESTEEELNNNENSEDDNGINK